ncbi:Conserved_hypothetical protein [Hexamita inflata]|uniref:EF-hand domain-containing protein n=1 Tax=Hexamita inflata TaxID=28002 RepID=A0AA86THU7_9EUKA|nr:Conserved hypothetical protein [Hexamita inflata]
MEFAEQLQNYLKQSNQLVYYAIKSEQFEICMKLENAQFETSKICNIPFANTLNKILEDCITNPIEIEQNTLVPFHLESNVLLLDCQANNTLAGIFIERGCTIILGFDQISLENIVDFYKGVIKRVLQPISSVQFKSNAQSDKIVQPLSEKPNYNLSDSLRITLFEDKYTYEQLITPYKSQKYFLLLFLNDSSLLHYYIQIATSVPPEVHTVVMCSNPQLRKKFALCSQNVNTLQYDKNLFINSDAGLYFKLYFVHFNIKRINEICSGNDVTQIKNELENGSLYWKHAYVQVRDSFFGMFGLKYQTMQFQNFQVQSEKQTIIYFANSETVKFKENVEFMQTLVHSNQFQLIIVIQKPWALNTQEFCKRNVSKSISVALDHNSTLKIVQDITQIRETEMFIHFKSGFKEFKAFYDISQLQAELESIPGFDSQQLREHKQQADLTQQNVITAVFREFAEHECLTISQFLQIADKYKLSMRRATQVFKHLDFGKLQKIDYQQFIEAMRMLQWSPPVVVVHHQIKSSSQERKLIESALVNSSFSSEDRLFQLFDKYASGSDQINVSEALKILQEDGVCVDGVDRLPHAIFSYKQFKEVYNKQKQKVSLRSPQLTKLVIEEPTVQSLLSPTAQISVLTPKRHSPSIQVKENFVDKQLCALFDQFQTDEYLTANELRIILLQHDLYANSIPERVNQQEFIAFMKKSGFTSHGPLLEQNLEQLNENVKLAKRLSSKISTPKMLRPDPLQYNADLGDATYLNSLYKQQELDEFTAQIEAQFLKILFEAFSENGKMGLKEIIKVAAAENLQIGTVCQWMSAVAGETEEVNEEGFKDVMIGAGWKAI